MARQTMDGLCAHDAGSASAGRDECDMSKHKHGKRIVSQDEQFVVKVMPAAVVEPMSPEEVLEDHATFFEGIAGLAGSPLLGRAREDLLEEVREATENEERRGDPDEIIEVIRRR